MPSAEAGLAAAAIRPHAPGPIERDVTQMLASGGGAGGGEGGGPAWALSPSLELDPWAALTETNKEIEKRLQIERAHAAARDPDSTPWQLV